MTDRSSVAGHESTFASSLPIDVWGRADDGDWFSNGFHLQR